jgi:hypothetical protein
MSSHVGPPDTPPGDGYITLVEYVAQHGLPYQRVYGWMRWGHVAGVRHGGRWWVPRDASQPTLRRGGWGQEERLRVIRAQRSPESWRGTWDRVAAAARVDPEQRREMGRCGGSSPKRRRNHGPCLACGERPATVKGRCARCNAYWLYRGVERPATVPRRGPQAPTGPRRRADTRSG